MSRFITSSLLTASLLGCTPTYQELAVDLVPHDKPTEVNLYVVRCHDRSIFRYLSEYQFEEEEEQNLCIKFKEAE